MDITFRKLLGLVDNDKHIYRFDESRVQKEEFTFCQALSTMLFGEKGLVDTLGPTWNLVHDPRFVAIESCFVFNRQARLGGDARLGVSVQGEGLFCGSLADLEQYAEILGEGREWVRLCNENGLDPRTLKDADSALLWRLVRSNWPNYFNRAGVANKEANRLIKLVQADLVGLVADYAEVAHVQEWIHFETGELVSGTEMADPEVPKVYLEVDNLERALTVRATLRATAARILDQMGILASIKDKDITLTDVEIDYLLRKIYQSDWPENLGQISLDILMYLDACTKEPYEVRLEKQLQECKRSSQSVVAKLKSGELKPITRETDDTSEVPLDDAAKLVLEIQNDPCKTELFLIMAEAERRNLSEVVAMLSPIFEKPGYELTGEAYFEFKKKAAEYSASKLIETEEQFEGKQADTKRLTTKYLN